MPVGEVMTRYGKFEKWDVMVMPVDGELLVDQFSDYCFMATWIAIWLLVFVINRLKSCSAYLLSTLHGYVINATPLASIHINTQLTRFS